MSTIVKKLRNINPYNIGVFESWLSGMAKKGLVLVGINNVTCSFHKLEAVNMEYRLDISDQPMTKEKVEVYKQCGWDYICSYKDIHIFCAFASEELVEMYTDPEEQSYTLKYVTKRFRIVSIVLLICTVFIIADTIFLLHIGNAPYINLLENGWQTCVSTFAIIIVVIISLKQLYECMAIKKTLAMGKPINHHSDWKKGTRLYSVTTCISLFLSIVVLIEAGFQFSYIIGYLNGSNSYNLTLDTELPILRLSNIEESKGAVLKEDIFADGYNGSNRVNKKNDLLLKTHYEVTETYYVAGETWNDRDDVYAPSLTTNYYELSIPFLVSGVMKDLVYTAEKYFDHRYENLGNGNEAVQLKYDGLDDVYYMEDSPGYFIIVARKDNKIYKLLYNGKQNYTKILGALVENLK